jgi:HD-GYP domain-containing protein (c-di-GMP phosphodiesterase class II)
VRLLKITVLAVLVVSLIPTLMVGWLSVADTSQLLTQDAQELAKERVKLLRLRVERILEEPVHALTRVAQLPGFFDLAPAEQHAQLYSLFRLQPGITTVSVLSADGNFLMHVRLNAGSADPSAAYRARVRSLLEGAAGIRYSEVYFVGPREVPALTALVPSPDIFPEFLAAEVSLDGLSGALAEETAGGQGVAYVMDLRGRMVAGAGDAGGSRNLSSRPPASGLAKLFSNPSLSSGIRVEQLDSGTERVVAAYELIPQVGWGVVWEQPIAAAYGKVARVRRSIVWGVAWAVIAAIILALLFARKLTRPIKQFTVAALQIAQGQFGVRVEVKGKNELAELAQTFNYMSSALQAYDSETKGLYQSVEKGYLETIVALAHAIDSKDTYTRGHSQRVGDLSMEIGRELGFTERQLRQLQYGGILHDIGKIGIAESILRKGSQLTAEEMQIMRSHPALGEAIIEPVGFLLPIRAAARNHHERWDGAGYPDGLKGEAIPLVARIVNCADTFDACTSTRPYQKGLPATKAMEIIEGLKGTQLDPKVVDALRRVVTKKTERIKAAPVPVKQAG